MKIFRPGSAPLWLEHVLTSIERGLREIWPLPFRLWRVPTADLPPAADHEGAWLYDSTSLTPKFSNGTSWFAVEAAIAAGTTAQYWRGDKSWQTLNGLAVANTPAGNIAATTVQAAINELDTEKVASNGALGTPSSGTLTNCAGLPTAGILDDAVTNAKAANMAQSTIKGRASGAGTGDPTDLTVAQAMAVLAAGPLYSTGNTLPNSTNACAMEYAAGEGYFSAINKSSGGAETFVPLNLRFSYLKLLSGVGNYADDAAAAAGGVPVTGVYRNGSVLMIRVA